MAAVPFTETLVPVAAGVLLVGALLHYLATKPRITLQPSTKPRTILITGGTSGIGMATADLFKKKGWIVGICGTTIEKAESIGKQILADAAYKLNVVKPEECAQVCTLSIYFNIDAKVDAHALDCKPTRSARTSPTNSMG